MEQAWFVQLLNKVKLFVDPITPAIDHLNVTNTQTNVQQNLQLEAYLSMCGILMETIMLRHV